MKNPIQIKILDSRIGKTIALPKYATAGSAGMDLRACTPENTTLTVRCNETVLIPTGISMFIENPNLCAMILPRSGLGHNKGIVLGNLTGVMDSDYQGELFISCWNRNNPLSENKHFNIFAGDRIAQIVFLPITQVDFLIVDSFDETKRGNGGFGHSGIS